MYRPLTSAAGFHRQGNESTAIRLVDPASSQSNSGTLPPIRSRPHRALLDRSVRHFIHACDAQLQLDTIVYSRVLLQNDLADMLSRKMHGRGVRRIQVTPEQFRSISTTARASGIGAIAAQPWQPLSRLEPAGAAGWIAIESMRAPGNLGTVLRTAEATGMSGIFFLTPQPDPFDPAVVRASMGGLFHLRLIRTTHEALGRWCRSNGVRIVGLSPDAHTMWTELPASPSGTALIIGEERHGLTGKAAAICDAMVRLPMAGHADSLNVGVAAGVMMYELVRRAHRPAAS